MTNQPLITEGTLSRATLDALLDPLISRAEQELSKTPQRVEVPAGFSWPEDVQKRLAAHDAEWEKWAERNTELAEKLEDYQAAARADESALRDAIKKGGKKHPGTPKSDTARVELEFALTACEMSRSEASRAVAGLHDLLKAAASVSQAREALEKAERDTLAIIASMQSHIAELNQQRFVAVSMANYVGEKLGYRFGEYEGRVNVQFPDPYQLRLASLVDHLNQ